MKQTRQETTEYEVRVCDLCEVDIEAHGSLSVFSDTAFNIGEYDLHEGCQNIIKKFDLIKANIKKIEKIHSYMVNEESKDKKIRSKKPMGDAPSVVGEKTGGHW